MILKYLIVFLIVLGVSDRFAIGLRVFNRTCPTDRPIVKNFKVDKYAGLWYEYLRKDEVYEFLGDCNIICYTPHENGTIGIKEYKYLEQGEDIVDTTYAVFTEPNQEPLEGRWNVSYKWNDPYFNNHWILATDYYSYSITFVCLPNGQMPESFDEFTVYTRKPIPTRFTVLTIERILTKHYKLEDLYKPKQGSENCNYL